MTVIVAGVSTRAAADSAVRAGMDVCALDAFGDLDQHPDVRAISLPRDLGVRFSAMAAARAARGLDADAAMYLSNFENDPRAVATLSAGRALWGNPPAILRLVRDPFRLAAELDARGIATPTVSATPPPPAVTLDGRREQWLIKPRASGGGRRVRPWTAAAAARGQLPRGMFAQAFVPGLPASAVFVAAEGRAVLLGLTRQLVGEAACGATGYQYCGSILCSPGDPMLPQSARFLARVLDLTSAVAEAFRLVGVNGVDLVAADDWPVAVEVNPRWSASMELVERACGVNVFAAHLEACVSGRLPAHVPAVGAVAFGKAVVFARHAVVVGDTRQWPMDPTVRDIPHPGERIAAGSPICTVFASAPDGHACHAALVSRAAQVYAEIHAWCSGVPSPCLES